MDPETKKAAEYCQIAGVGHVVASKPPLKPLVRYRTSERLPEMFKDVLTPQGVACVGWNSWVYRSTTSKYPPTWWAYLPEGDE